MRTTSDLGRRQAAEALYTGNPRSDEARRLIRDETGFDLGAPAKPIDPETARKNVLGGLALAALVLLVAPLYMAARGLWMDEPLVQPHHFDGGIFIGFVIFVLASLGLFLTASRRLHPLAAFVAGGTILLFGILHSANGWGMAAFLVAELAFLGAWAQHRRAAAKKVKKGRVGKAIRDWTVLIFCALVLMAMSVEPEVDTFVEGMSDAGSQLGALFTQGLLARAGEIAAPFGLPGLAVAVGIPAALALLYVPLTWAVSKVMRWA